jgi:hypothetical protein
MSDKPEVNSEAREFWIYQDMRDHVTEHFSDTLKWHQSFIDDQLDNSPEIIHVIEYSAFEAQAVLLDECKNRHQIISSTNKLNRMNINELRRRIESLEQMRSLDQNAIEAKDHKIVLLEKENAELKRQLELQKNVISAAIGISFGHDWNNGTHANLYRNKLIDAVAALTKPQTEGEI